MIFAKLTDDLTAYNFPTPILKGLEFLKTQDLENLAIGKHEIDGDNIYVSVDEVKTKELADARFESHEQYIDVQCVISGEEKIGFAMKSDKATVAEWYADRDLIFYSDVEKEGYIHSSTGHFCIFFPEDLHQPLVKVGDIKTIKKCVVKIKMSLLR